MRSAQSGDVAALQRIHGVSKRVNLSAAQLVVAREHGCSSWGALRLEVDQRRATHAPPASPTEATSSQTTRSNVPSGVWRGSGSVTLAQGVLSPGTVPRSISKHLTDTQDHATVVPTGRLVDPSRAALDWMLSHQATFAKDDLGGSYISMFGGSGGAEGHEDVKLQFGPRLDPTARTLRLVFQGTRDALSVDIVLPEAS